MNLSKALFMSLMLSLGALYLWKFEQENSAIDENVSVSKEAPVFQGITESQIKRISVIHPDENFAIERRPSVENKSEASKGVLTSTSTWVLQSPPGAAVDQSKMRSILSSILDLKAKNTIEKVELEGDEAVYGLVPPPLVLSLSGDFGERVLVFGEKHSVSGRRYAQPQEQEKIFLVDDDIFTLLKVTSKSLRDRQPLKFDVQKVDSFNLIRSGNDILRFRKSQDGKQWLVSNNTTELIADYDLTMASLRELGNVNVKEFVDQIDSTLAVYGLVSPKLIVSLSANFVGGAAENTTAEETIIQIGEGVDTKLKTEFGGESAGDINSRRASFFKISGIDFIYQASRAFYADLLQPIDYFRERSPLGRMNFDSLNRIVIERTSPQPENFSLIKDVKNNKWMLESKNASGAEERKEIETEKLQNWLKEMLLFRVLSYPAVEGEVITSFGLQSPRVKLELYEGPQDGSGDKLISKLLVGAEVAPSTTTSKDESGVNPEDASKSPSYAAIIGADGKVIPVVVNAENVGLLDKKVEYFVSISK